MGSVNDVCMVGNQVESGVKNKKNLEAAAAACFSATGTRMILPSLSHAAFLHEERAT